MKKKYNCKPATEVEIAFEDGKTIFMRFDVKALIHLSEFEGGMDFLANNEENIAEICARIVYASSCEYEENMTLGFAQEIVCNMDIATLTNIISDFSESMNVVSKDLQGEQRKNLMNQFQSKKK